jgi:glucose/arabinose dehydrogenase
VSWDLWTKWAGARRRADRSFRLAVEWLEGRVTPTNLPAGFTETTAASGFSGPTAMEFAPDGRLFVLEQGGNVKLVQNGGTTFTALHLTVDSAGERGVLGIAFDPNFAANHFVYLYYTNPNAGASPWATGEHNQLSRFTVDDTNPQQPKFTSEAPILDWDNLSSATNHNGGAIHFGLDGMLYADAGDNVQTFTGPDNNTYRVSQTLANLLGKQLRIDVSKFNSGVATRDDTTVGHLIPADNPFVGVATGINQLIYALGLRNPFTFAVQPGTGKIFINDVGEGTFEEIDQSIAGGNYGWRGGNSDGFGHPPPSFAPGTYHDPLLAYNHSGGPAGGGAAIVGGTFYNPATAQFPASYVGKYFYEDLAAGWIRVFDPANPGTMANPDTSSAFADGTAGGLRDLKVDSVGNLYYLSGGDGAVHKVSYQAPQITAQPTDQTVNQGQPATFAVTAAGPALSYQWQHLVGTTWMNVGTSAPTLTVNNTSPADAGSYRVAVSNTFGSVTSSTATLTVSAPGAPPSITGQPTNQQANVGQSTTFTVVAGGAAPLGYQWQHLVGTTWTNVGGNASTLTVGPLTTADAGSYRVVISNVNGTATSSTAMLTVNQLPVVTITAPAPTLTYNFGQTVNFAGTATDPEDGTLAPARLAWEVRFYHEDAPDGTGLHFHPFQTFTGVGSGSIVTDFPETSPLVWYRFILTATDSAGATASTFVDVHPNTATFTLTTSPPGLQLLLDGGPIADGTAVTGVVGQPRTVGVVSPQTVGGIAYTFGGWSDGGAASHTIATPSADTTLTANFFVPIPPPPPPPPSPPQLDPVLVGFKQFAAGADAGGSPRATLYNPDGSVRLNQVVFDQSFSGGVRTAAADFNGDGVADLVVGTGPGAPTVVRVLDGQSGTELFQVKPFESAFTGGVFVAAGDLTGDGTPDLVITPDVGGGPRVVVYDGRTFALAANFFGIDDPNFRGGARAAVGDLNGDRVGDLVVAAGFGGGPRIAAFDGRSVTSTPVKLFGDIFVFEQTLRNGVFVTVGDLNGDGFADLIVGGGPGGGPRVLGLSGKDLVQAGGSSPVQLANFFAGDPSSRGGVRVAVKNLDGDGRADLVVGAGEQSGSRLTAYAGVSIPVDGQPPELMAFDAFPGFGGGVFVG